MSDVHRDDTMFRPPVNRAMRVLDRNFFKTETAISAAKVFDMKQLSRIRGAMVKSKDILDVRQLHPIQSVPPAALKGDALKGKGKEGEQKCILLRPGVVHDDEKTWSETIAQLVRAGDVSLMPWQLKLDYNHWTYHEIMSSILPEDLLDDLPGAFAHAGHIAQVNLRPAYLPHAPLIGAVILDKNPSIRTVINKADTLTSSNIFRALDFDLIAGDSDYLVTTKEGGCTFRFDYSKVFWNSRLSTEHARLVDRFKEGEMVCDVMAGVGPFAVPAGKKGVFVWANDLNPECAKGLEEAIQLNKVSQHVRAFCSDGHTFIPTSADLLLRTSHTARIPRKLPRHILSTLSASDPSRYTLTPQPLTFDHYVMNLPSTAPLFLPSFRGLYAGHEDLFEPHTDRKLPMVHCYAFGPKHDQREDPEAWGPRREVCEEVSRMVGARVSVDGDGEADGEAGADLGSNGEGEGAAGGKEGGEARGKGRRKTETEIWDVRDVAPNKRQYCASFRLPRSVAFAARPVKTESSDQATAGGEHAAPVLE